MRATEEIEDLLFKADKLGIKLEIDDGKGVWEAFPSLRHQKETDRIRRSIGKNPNYDGPCDCVHYADVYVKLSENNFKRPDISIFCREPDELDRSITLIPEAVIEIVSPGSEEKDLHEKPLQYLAHGVGDVVVFNPYSLTGWHIREDNTRKFHSPEKIFFMCGCQCEI